MTKRAKLAATQRLRPAGQVEEALQLCEDLREHDIEHRAMLDRSEMHRDMALRDLAHAMAGGDRARASDLLLHAAESLKYGTLTRVRPPMFGPWGGRVDTNFLNCPFGMVDLCEARDQLIHLFDQDECNLFRKVNSPHLSGGADIVWEGTERCFNRDAVESFMGLGPLSETDTDRFGRVGAFHRKVDLFLRRTMCTEDLRVERASIHKQLDDSGCLERHLESDKRLQSCILILAIYDFKRQEGCDHTSPDVPCGVDVFTSYSGEPDDRAESSPVRCPLNQVGDCMILRGAHFANMTVKPPPNFEVFKYVVWFSTSGRGPNGR